MRSMPRSPKLRPAKAGSFWEPFCGGGGGGSGIFYLLWMNKFLRTKRVRLLVMCSPLLILIFLYSSQSPHDTDSLLESFNSARTGDCPVAPPGSGLWIIKKAGWLLENLHSARAGITRLLICIPTYCSEKPNAVGILAS